MILKDLKIFKQQLLVKKQNSILWEDPEKISPAYQLLKKINKVKSNRIKNPID